MRASRLLSLLMLLQTRGRMTAPELARELEVSVRTIYRDVESLGAAGVPIYAERGPAGGYHLVEGYRTRLTGLTSDEAESLFLAGAPGAAAELGLGSVLAAAELKLLAALPPELRSRAGRIRERFHLDAPGWFHDAEPLPYLAAVADAVWNQRSLRVRYRRWGGEVSRTLDPLGLVLKGGTWYLAACAADPSTSDDIDPADPVAPADPPSRRLAIPVRTYRVSRILALETLDGRFTRPAGFDLAAYWRGWLAQFDARVYRLAVVVRVAPRVLEILPHIVQTMTLRDARETAEPPDASGWTELTLVFESINHALLDLLRLGDDAEVLAPPEVRTRMAETAAAMAAVYGAVRRE